MARVIRLVTLTDLRDDRARPATSGEPEHVERQAGWHPVPGRLADQPADPSSISFSARHEAVLDDGRRVLLLDDRGWVETLSGAGASELPGRELPWEHDIAETARMVVGPDEPFGGHSQDDMETDHWNALAETLRGHNVTVDPADLRQLPHDVQLGERILERLGRSRREERRP
ncbi:MAG: hypothetical protein QOJ13_1614 [Gaiellales bacterium]|jgi:hypothetical protein|nr:hypothetical protein [Gaiellales bacterium]